MACDVQSINEFNTFFNKCASTQDTSCIDAVAIQDQKAVTKDAKTRDLRCVVHDPVAI